MKLAYCPDLHDRIARLRAFYERRAEDRIFAVMDVPRKAVRAFAARYAAGPCDCPPIEERVRFWDDLLREAACLHDDKIPCVYITEFDQGLYGGLLGGEVRFTADPNTGWISSMVPPLLSDWDGFENLKLDTEGKWARWYRERLGAYAGAANGRFGIGHFVIINGFNFMFELLGATRTYLEAELHPEKVKAALDFALELNTWVQDRFFEAVPLLEGGTVSNSSSWLPGRIMSESVDPFGMASADYFIKWGIEPLERLFARYDGGTIHLHGNGRHLLEVASQVKGMKAIRLLDDGDVPPAFEVLPDLKKRARGVPVIIAVSFQEFSRALAEHRLIGGVMYRVEAVPDDDTANEIMDRIREYRE